MSNIYINFDSYNSIYEIKFNNYSDEDFFVFSSQYKKIFSTHKIHNIIFNAQNLNYVSFNQICSLCIFLQNMKPIHKLKLNKFVIIITNQNIKRILNCVFLLVPPVRPYKICLDIESSREFLKDYSNHQVGSVPS